MLVLRNQNYHHRFLLKRGSVCATFLSQAVAFKWTTSYTATWLLSGGVLLTVVVWVSFCLKRGSIKRILVSLLLIMDQGKGSIIPDKLRTKILQVDIGGQKNITVSPDLFGVAGENRLSKLLAECCDPGPWNVESSPDMKLFVDYSPEAPKRSQMQQGTACSKYIGFPSQ